MDQWFAKYLERKKKKEDKKRIKEEKKKKKYISIENDPRCESDDDKLEKLDSLVGSIVDESDIDDASITNGGKLEVLDLGEAKPIKGKRNERYHEYVDALESSGVLNFIKKSLETEDAIVVRNFDIAKNLGKIFTRKHHTSLYWGLKYVLFNNGIVCEERVHKSDTGIMGKLLYMRKKRAGDSLPPSLEFIRNKIKNKKRGRYGMKKTI